MHIMALAHISASIATCLKCHTSAESDIAAIFKSPDLDKSSSCRVHLVKRSNQYPQSSETTLSYPYIEATMRVALRAHDNFR